jgi:RNA recognition motif-containing protein
MYLQESSWLHILMVTLSQQENPLEKDYNQGTLAVINLDPSVTNDDLQHIFGGYGEIKEVFPRTIQLLPQLEHHQY